MDENIFKFKEDKEGGDKKDEGGDDDKDADDDKDKKKEKKKEGYSFSTEDAIK